MAGHEVIDKTFVVMMESKMFMSVREFDMRRRKCIQLLASKILDDTNGCFIAKQIFFNKDRAVRIEQISQRIGKFKNGGNEEDAAPRPFHRRLHDIRRAELREDRSRHLVSPHRIFQRERSAARCRYSRLPE